MMDEIRIFEKENTLTFLERKKMIQFVSIYMAIQYKKFLKSEYAMKMDSAEEEDYWEYKIFSNVSKFEMALGVLLPIYLRFNKEFEITHESDILKSVFKVVGETILPKSCFDKNVKYRIKDLTFEKIIYWVYKTDHVLNVICFYINYFFYLQNTNLNI